MKDKPENPQWIDVRKELPPEHEKVLVILEVDTVLLGVMDRNTRNNRWSIFWADGKYKENLDRPVTHWMEIPNLPQQADSMLAERSKSDE